MHELSLARELVRLVDQQCDLHGYRQVKQIHLQLGAFSCVAPEALCFAFDSVRYGRLEQTRLQIRQVETRGGCTVCGYQAMLNEAYAACARCGGMMMPQEVDEMRVTELEVI
jgi:hydrogenase nickel incorporation protein HypA/HybF